MPEPTESEVVDLQVNDEPEKEVEPSEPETREQPKPGTPDKALQKMQQELGNVTRELAALKEQKATGELSEAQKQKLAKAEERLTRIRSFANRPDRNDLPSEVDPVADHLLELTEKVGKQDSLEEQLRAANDRLERLENARNWEVARAKFSGLDVDAIWEKAWNDAAKVLRGKGDEEAQKNVASNLFEERCEAAKKRLKEDPKKPEKGGSPSSYKVGSGQKIAPVLSDEEEALEMARTLVVDI